MPTEFPSDRKVKVMLDWRLTGMRAGLTDLEMATMAAQFAGLCVIRVPLTGQGHMEIVDICQHMIATAALGASAMASGAAVRRPRAEEPA